jgi:hypothetical protein
MNYDPGSAFIPIYCGRGRAGEGGHGVITLSSRGSKGQHRGQQSEFKLKN